MLELATYLTTRVSSYLFDRRNDDDASEDRSINSDNLPRRGETVDSINYYSRELSVLNERMARMQHGKIELAQRGNDSARASQWISHAIDRVSTAAEDRLDRLVSDRFPGGETRFFNRVALQRVLNSCGRQPLAHFPEEQPDRGRRPHHRFRVVLLPKETAAPMDPRSHGGRFHFRRDQLRPTKHR